jgi:hypothetical protein
VLFESGFETQREEAAGRYALEKRAEGLARKQANLRFSSVVSVDAADESKRTRVKAAEKFGVSEAADRVLAEEEART